MNEWLRNVLGKAPLLREDRNLNVSNISEKREHFTKIFR